MDILTQTRTIDILRVVADLGFELQQFRKIVCPFHDEKTPSLVLYPRTNTYHCFGCGRHGDVINFYAGVSNQEYTPAMHELAFNYLPDYRPELYRRGHLKKIGQQTAGAKPVAVPADTKTYTYEPLHGQIYEEFQRFCEHLPVTPTAEDAWAYLHSRGFTASTLRKFRLFVVGDYEQTQAHLRNTFGLLDLQACGLFNEKGNLIFYRHPIIIPYYRKNRVVFLQGRIIGLPPDPVQSSFRIAKYQFLSGVPVELFNADVLDLMRTGQTVYLTEGAFDCMSLMQEGLPAVSLGSATMFKREWAKLFRRVEVCFFFDNDKAGQKAAREFSELFGQYRISTHVRQVKEGYKDVNEYFNRDR